MPKHDGVRVQIGGTEYVMPRLTFGPFKRHWKKILELRRLVEKGTDLEASLERLPELAEAQIALLHAALKRNYPDLTLEQLEDDIDIPTLARVLPLLFQVSGLATNEGNGKGEAESPAS